MRVPASSMMSVIPDLIRDPESQAGRPVALDPDVRQDDVEGFAS
jgi:hypothetical protein